MNINGYSTANGKDPMSILGFTNDQQKAYTELIKFINEEYNANDYKRALSGPAGSGKTYLVKALIKNCNFSYSVIKLSAPTHKACRVLKESINIPGVKAFTMASCLGFRPNYDAANFDIKNPPFDTKGKIKIIEEKPRLLIMDESSMIGRGELFYIEKFCRQVQCKILFIGDAYQLPPINEKYSPAFRGVTTCQLNQIVRQGDDNPISDILPILRKDIDNKTYNFLNYIIKNPSRFNSDFTKGYRACNLESFTELVKVNFNDESYCKNIEFTKLIAYTNLCVSGWNKFIRNFIIKDCDKSILTKNDLILSGITIVDKFNDTVIINSEEYVINDIVNYTHPKYNIRGFLVKFQAIYGGAISSPLFVVDHSDKFSINMYYKLSNELITAAKNAKTSVRAQRWRDYYEFKESCLLLVELQNSAGEVIINRNIDYGFSISAHKSQGSTYDTVFVDVDDIVFDKNGAIRTDCDTINRLLYVACSRCRNKLYIRFSKVNN